MSAIAERAQPAFEPAASQRSRATSCAPIRSRILHRVLESQTSASEQTHVDDEHCQEEHDRLEGREEETERLAHAPGDDDCRISGARESLAYRAAG